jgi:hypothetical protein
MSMLDPEVLRELPEDVRNEVIFFCQKGSVTSGQDDKPEIKASTSKEAKILIDLLGLTARFLHGQGIELNPVSSKISF